MGHHNHHHVVRRLELRSFHMLLLLSLWMIIGCSFINVVAAESISNTDNIIIKQLPNASLSIASSNNNKKKKKRGGSLGGYWGKPTTTAAAAVVTTTTITPTITTTTTMNYALLARGGGGQQPRQPVRGVSDSKKQVKKATTTTKKDGTPPPSGLFRWFRPNSTRRVRSLSTCLLVWNCIAFIDALNFTFNAKSNLDGYLVGEYCPHTIAMTRMLANCQLGLIACITLLGFTADEPTIKNTFKLLMLVTIGAFRAVAAGVAEGTIKAPWKTGYAAVMSAPPLVLLAYFAFVF